MKRYLYECYINAKGWIKAFFIASMAICALEIASRFTVVTQPMAIIFSFALIAYAFVAGIIVIVKCAVLFYRRVKSDHAAVDYTLSVISCIIMITAIIATCGVVLALIPNVSYELPSAGEAISSEISEYTQVFNDFTAKAKELGYMSPLFLISSVFGYAVNTAEGIIILFSALTFARWREHPLLGSFLGYCCFDIISDFIYNLMYSLCTLVSPGIKTISQLIASLRTESENQIEMLRSLTSSLPPVEDYYKIAVLSCILTVISCVTCVLIATAILNFKFKPRTDGDIQE